MWTVGAVKRQSGLTKVARSFASWRWNALSISWRRERICPAESVGLVWQNTDMDARMRNNIRESMA